MRAIFSLMSVSFLVAFSGCSVDEVVVERTAVRGKVTLDGKPLQAAAIVFIGEIPPSEASEQNTSPVIAHAIVKNGMYQLESSNGPATGDSRVEIRPQPLSREQMEAALDANLTSSRPKTVNVVDIPERYGSDSPLTAELVSGIENEMNFKLTSRP